jgi:hypothetical protein
MVVLEVSRDVGDKRRFALSSVGTVTRGKFWNDATTLVVDDGSATWQVTNTKVFKPVFVAVDPQGVERARFDLNHRDVTVGERRLHLETTPAGWIKKAGDHRLVENGHDLVGFGRRVWGRRPVAVTVYDEQLLRDPMLLLFAANAADRLSAHLTTQGGAAPMG